MASRGVTFVQRHEWTLGNETLGDLGGVPDSREHGKGSGPALLPSLCVRRELMEGRRKGALLAPDSSGPYERLPG